MPNLLGVNDHLNCCQVYDVSPHCTSLEMPDCLVTAQVHLNETLCENSMLTNICHLPRQLKGPIHLICIKVI